jgi:hypothetical protein
LRTSFLPWSWVHFIIKNVPKKLSKEASWHITIIPALWSIYGQPELRGKFQASMGHIARLCLKKRKEKKKKKKKLSARQQFCRSCHALCLCIFGYFSWWID